MKFLDQAKIFIKSGNGGGGSTAGPPRETGAVPGIGNCSEMLVFASGPIRKFVLIQLAQKNPAGCRQTRNSGGIHLRNPISQNP